MNTRKSGKIVRRMASLLSLILLLSGIGYAWYDNNRQSALSGNNYLTVSSGGTLQMALADTDPYGALVPLDQVNYSATLNFDMGRSGYDDITGDGVNFYLPVLDDKGEPDASDTSMWEKAEADRASVENDSGQYVNMDIYMKSDVPMEIYLTDASVLQAKGTSLVEKPAGYNGRYDQYGDQLSSVNTNTNASMYGFFSRNLICGAGRVSFAEYGMTGTSGDSPSYTAPKTANVVWVPNSTYQLKKAPSSEYLDDFELNGTAEKGYSFYVPEYADGNITGYQKKTVQRSEQTGKLTGVLYRINGDIAEIVENVTSTGDGSYQSAIKINNSFSVPAIWDGSRYVTAAAYTTVEGGVIYVKAEYQSASVWAYVFSNEKKYIKETNGTDFVEVTYNSSTKKYEINQNGVTLSHGDADSYVIKDTGEYEYTRWIDDTDFGNVQNAVYNCSPVPVASTRYQLSDGCYYTRVSISVWVEGTDREADIALNGGSFGIKLSFYGLPIEGGEE